MNMNTPRDATRHLGCSWPGRIGEGTWRLQFAALHSRSLDSQLSQIAEGLAKYEALVQQDVERFRRECEERGFDPAELMRGG